MTASKFTTDTIRLEVTGDSKSSGNGRCNMARSRCFLLIVFLAAIFFLYNCNVTEFSKNRAPDWWIQYTTIKNWTLFRAAVKADVSSEMYSSERTQNFASDKESVSYTEKTSSFSSSSLPGAKIRDTAEPGTTLLLTEPFRASDASSVTQPSSLVPYVSPGPYLVEYPYEYHFTINEPDKCQQQRPFVVLVVPVAPHNRKHRDSVRRTWGSEKVVKDKTVTLVFLLGKQTGDNAEQIQNDVLQESKEHGDLIQSNFVDCYKNLTIKSMVMMEWLAAHCSSATYAMKVDSDMFLNVEKLIDLLLTAPKTNYMTGLVARRARVLRDPISKWYLPERLYPNPSYPRYALGLGYIVSTDLPKKLVEASRHVKALYIEDVYLGLCMQHLGIPPTDPPSWYYFHVFPLQYNRCEYSKIIATTTKKDTDIVWLWTDFKRPGPYC